MTFIKSITKSYRRTMVHFYKHLFAKAATKAAKNHSSSTIEKVKRCIAENSSDKKNNFYINLIAKN